MHDTTPVTVHTVTPRPLTLPTFLLSLSFERNASGEKAFHLGRWVGKIVYPNYLISTSEFYSTFFGTTYLEVEEKKIIIIVMMMNNKSYLNLYTNTFSTTFIMSTILCWCTVFY